LKSCVLEGANFKDAIITGATFENSNTAKAKNLNIEILAVEKTDDDGQ
jgi:uncharacterized protein YjbI with pentapeptide repeats